MLLEIVVWQRGQTDDASRSIWATRVPEMPRISPLHQPLMPLIAVAIGATGIVPALWLAGSLVWLGHVLAGRALGDVPRGRGRGADA